MISTEYRPPFLYSPFSAAAGSLAAVFSCLLFCAYMYRQAYAKQGFCGRVIVSCHIVLFDMKNFSSIICAIWIFTNGQVCSIIEEHPKNGPKPSFIPPAQLSLFIAKYQPYDTLMQEQSRMCCFFVIGYRLSVIGYRVMLMNVWRTIQGLSNLGLSLRAKPKFE